MTDTPPPPPPAAPARAAPRWMRVLLVLSLALNLLVAGLVLGAILVDGPGRGPRPVEMELGPIARALDQSDRRAILGSLRGHPDLRPFARADMAADIAALQAALRADPFDPDAARAALASRAQRVERAQAAVQEALLARVAAMTPDQRAALADRLEDEGGRRR